MSARRQGTRCNAWSAWSALCSATRPSRTVRQSAGALLLSWACRSRRPPSVRARVCGARLGPRGQVDRWGFRARPSADKRAKWLERVRAALAAEELTAGAASKLAGALSWGASHQFRRLGRAMLRPLFAHAHGRSAKLSADAMCCLRWWAEVLAHDIVETRAWAGGDERPPVVILADARGTPPNLAAVVCIDGRVEYTAWEPPGPLLRRGSIASRARARPGASPASARKAIPRTAGRPDCRAGNARSWAGNVHVGQQDPRPRRPHLQ